MTHDLDRGLRSPAVALSLSDSLRNGQKTDSAEQEHGSSIKASATVEAKPRLPDSKDVDKMAASIDIEHESGTYTGRVHPHNGYYAGDFSSSPVKVPQMQLVRRSQTWSTPAPSSAAMHGPRC